MPHLARLSCAIEIARSKRSADSTILRIHKESQRLNNLVDELLEVAAAEGDPDNASRELIGLNQLAAELLEDCKIEADAKSCSLRFEPDTDVDVQGDFELLRRAVENILRNAIRYAP